MSLSDRASNKKVKNAGDASTEEWVAWDIRTFEKIETERDQASENKGIDLKASFQPLYEKKKMAPEDRFVLMYQKEKDQSDSGASFEPSFIQPPPLSQEEPQANEAPLEREDSPMEKMTPERDPEPVEATPRPEKRSPPPETKIDTEGIKRAAYEEGFQKGVADGYQKGLSDAVVPVQMMQNLLSGMEDLWNRMIRANEDKILKLIGLVMDKIVYGHVALDSDVVKKSVLDAFYLLTEPETAVIYVNKEDYDHIDAVKDDFFKEIAALKQVSIIADPAVSQGGCRIESESGEVDATIESRLETVKKSIRDALLKSVGSP